MHTLHLTEVGDNHLGAIRAVREALGALGLSGPLAGVRAADKIIEDCKETGYALLGSSPDLVLLANITKLLRDADCNAVTDFDPAEPRHRRRQQVREDRAAKRTPEEVFADRAPGQAPPTPAELRDDRAVYSTEAYETALVLVVASSGNPVTAAAHCTALARSTQDDTLYREVQDALVQTFPHIEEPLVANEVRLT